MREKIIKILNELREDSIEKIAFYDTKDLWTDDFKKTLDIEHKIFNINYDYDRFNNYEKMLLYKRINGRIGVDCDVSLRTMIIYSLAFDFVLENNRKISNTRKKYILFH